jgi:hypothetical protein
MVMASTAIAAKLKKMRFIEIALPQPKRVSAGAAGTRVPSTINGGKVI